MVLTTNLPGIYRLDMDRILLEKLSDTGSDPSWSPRGNTIIYTYQSDIYRLPGDNLTCHPALDIFPEWLPDGRIIFSSTRNRHNLPNHWDYVMDPDGENVEEFLIYLQNIPVRTRGIVSHTFSFSPDGMKIVFVGLAVNDEKDRIRQGIFIQDIETGEEILVFENPELYPRGYESFNNPVFSPDMKKIAFTSNVNTFYENGIIFPIWDLFVINTDGSGRIQLTRNKYGDNLSWIAWRPSPVSVAVKDKSVATPLAFSLSPAVPNPFNPTTAISFTLPAPGSMRLAVHSVTGQMVRELSSGRLSPGRHTAVWDGRDDRGRKVSSGIYMVRLDAGGKTAARKITLAR
ncbi:MAG: FlgD immunoglobulin-like domain containing protein [Candidatus Latescibacterota bacterium]